MDKAINEIPILLEIIHKSDSPTHFEFPGDGKLRRQFAEALKWAYEARHKRGEDEAYKQAKEVFWEWWSKPMCMPVQVNLIWKRKAGDNPDFNKEADIEYYKQQWEDEFNKALPVQSSLAAIRAYSKTICEAKDVYLNPDTSDKTISQITMKLLSKEFIVVTADGSSIVWDPKEKLWIARDKTRSYVALGEQLNRLITLGKIRFTDDKLESAFIYKISNIQCQSTLTWLKGVVPKFPNPIKDQLNRAKYMVPLLNGKIIDVQTLKIRDRRNEDWFTVETNIEWLENHKTKDDTYIMDEKIFSRFKDLTKQGGAKVATVHMPEIKSLMKQLCPNAWKFTEGPFREPDRHWPLLLRLGLSVTAHCQRKAIWVYGDGKGLKSTVFNAIVNCLGKFGCAIAKKVLFSTYGTDTSHNTDLMRCEGKRLMWIDELEKSDRLKETLYKLLVAHGLISSREIYGAQTEWQPMGLVLIATNTVPAMEFSDSSIPDRIFAIKATTKVFNPNIAKDLPPHYGDGKEWKDSYAPDDKEKKVFWVKASIVATKWSESFMLPENEGGFRNELGCLLLLAGHVACKILTEQDDGDFPVTSILTQDNENFFREADHIGRFFEDYCELDEKNPTATRLVFSEYKQFCGEQGIKHPMQQKNMVKSLKLQGVREFKVKSYDKNGRWNLIDGLGVRLKSSQNFASNVK